MKKEMLINVLQPEESRIAIVEDDVLEELYVERTSHESYVGNIYKGRIVNIEPSIQAAFVDFGVGRNGFLHVSDVEPAYYRHLEERPRGDGGRRSMGRDRYRTQAPREGDPDAEDPRRRQRREERSSESRRSAAEPGEGGDREDAPRRGGRGRRGRGRRGPRREDIAIGTRREPAPEPGDELNEAVPSAEHEARFAADDSPDTVRDERPDQHEDHERPRYMDSAERRTDENTPASEPLEPASSFGTGIDDELFFPRAEPVEDSPSRAADTAPPVTQEEEPSVLDFSGAEASSVVEDESTDAPPVEFDDESAPASEDEEFMPRPHRRRDDDRRGRRGNGGGRGGRRGGPGRVPFGRPKPLIQDIFRRGQEVLVQVIKEGIGTKGPTLSTYISIAGRYLVLMPGLNRIGVSRKIADEEQRRRLREVLSELKPPRGLGFIIRTAGLDKNKRELQRDLAYLSRLWQVVVRRIRKQKSPAEIYQESDMITRTIRDTFTSEIDAIWVDEPTAFEHAQEFLQIVMPRYANRIKLYDGLEPLFHKYGIESEIARIQQRHVPLPHGGSIVIDQTEALVAIDVNSGNFRADNNAEETAYQMNLHAAKEIARQLRLRDLGGVIVNDFIDMREEKHRRGVERAMRDAVKRDRARTKVLKISQFGIIEMTRQRIRPSLKRSVYQDCAHCKGTGQVKTCESMSIDVMRMVQLAAHHENVTRIDIRVADDVAHYLLNKKRKEIAKLEERDMQVNINGVSGASPELLELVCTDSNNSEIKLLPPEETPRLRRR